MASGGWGATSCVLGRVRGLGTFIKGFLMSLRGKDLEGSESQGPLMQGAGVAAHARVLFPLEAIARLILGFFEVH